LESRFDALLADIQYSLSGFETEDTGAVDAVEDIADVVVVVVVVVVDDVVFDDEDIDGDDEDDDDDNDVCLLTISHVMES
jgi:hypothetical protein